ISAKPNTHFWTFKAFLTPTIKNNHRHIVTVASFAGHLPYFSAKNTVGVPCMVCYSSSKWSAVGFHESPKEELSLLKMDGIKTTCMCPVFMNTDSVKLLKAMCPLVEVEDSAKALMEGRLTNQKMIFVPWWAKFHQLMKCLQNVIVPKLRHLAIRKLTHTKLTAKKEKNNTKKVKLLFF
uniref:Estradiol 17-beta-dehydrogenase 11 n=1 Tax=Podarcis muralis TaxID=64176 RepID=A0A670J4Q7_PODMU